MGAIRSRRELVLWALGAGLLIAGCGGTAASGSGDGGIRGVTQLGVPARMQSAPPVACATSGGDLATPEGEFLPQGAVVSAVRGRCQGARHAFAGAKTSTLRVTLVSWQGAGRARMRLVDLLGAELAGLDGADSGSDLTVTLDHSGEVFVELQPEDRQAPGNRYELLVTCVSGCDLEYTRYPIVLMHGMMGTDKYLDLLEYFYQIPETLRDRGYAVFNPAVPGVSTAEIRAVDWQQHLDDLEAAGLGRRFNLIAHSQGGLDARYLISGLGDTRPVSLITVATPHRGSEVADLAAGLLHDSRITRSLYNDVMAELADLLNMGEADAAAQLSSMSVEAMAQWNDQVPDSPDVYYASWSGCSCGALEPACQQQENGEVVNVLLGPSYTLLEMLSGPNDGLVPDTSAQWGFYFGPLPADHMDEVGQIANDSHGPFDHLAFYLDQARLLSDLGF